MVMQYFPEVDRYFGFFENPVLHYLPSHWAAESLYWISRGMPDVAAYYIFIQFVVCLVFFVAATLLAKLIYKSTFFEFGQSGKQNNSVMKKNRFFSFEKISRFSSKTEVLIKKEFWTFFREPGQWIHFSIMIFLLIIFTASVGSIRKIEINDVRIQTIVFLTIFLFNAFLIASLSLRFVFPLLSLEGEVFWKILTSPIKYKQYLFTRFTLVFTIIFIISVILNIFSTRFYPVKITYLSVLLSFFITLCLSSINLGMGNLFVNFKENNPIRISSSHGAVISFLVCLVYLVVLIIILFKPAYLFFDTVRKGLQPEVHLFLVPAIIIILLSGIISYVFLLLSTNKKET
jgi:ABC-2 type transport system permease protein